MKDATDDGDDVNGDLRQHTPPEKKCNKCKFLKKTTVLEDFEVTIFVDDNGINHDSAILFENKEFTFFNQNDCKIFDRLEEVIKVNDKIDYYACQFSGANWHPSTFIMDEKLKKTRRLYDISDTVEYNFVKHLR